MKKLTLTVTFELTNKDFVKKNVGESVPTFVTRENAENDIVDYKIPRSLLSDLKKANADIASVDLSEEHSQVFDGRTLEYDDEDAPPEYDTDPLTDPRSQE